MSQTRYLVPSILIRKVNMENNNAAEIMSRIPTGILPGVLSLRSICWLGKTGLAVSTVVLSVYNGIPMP